MNIKDNGKNRDNVRLEFYDAKTGELVMSHTGHNMIVNAGLNLIRNAISRDIDVVGYVAVGSGSTGAAAGDTALVAEIERIPIMGYSDDATGTVTFIAIFEPNQGNGNLREFGLFDALTTGTLFARYVAGASFTKDTSLMLKIYWTVVFQDS